MRTLSAPITRGLRTPLADPAGPDPLRRLQHEMQEPTGPSAVRVLGIPEEYTLGGMPVLCAACDARRDWLFINQGRNVWIRCRCGHQWHEPEVTRADFDHLLQDAQPYWTHYATVGAAMSDLGFDGTFAGLYMG